MTPLIKKTLLTSLAIALMYFGTATNASAACSFGASSTIVTEEVSYPPPLQTQTIRDLTAE